MTDKQVIIDGVDVSRCPSYRDGGECINENIYPDYCKACSNCTYKLEQRLKRKEKECEELKEKLEKINLAVLLHNECPSSACLACSEYDKCCANAIKYDEEILQIIEGKRK